MSKRNRSRTKRHEPYLGTRRSELVSAEMENPMFTRDHAESPSNPKTIPVVVNIRESAIATLASKKALEPHQVAAADHFRKLWETMGGAGARAIDWRKEAVDGGMSVDPISAFQIDAGKELAVAFKTLKDHRGMDGYKLVCAVAGEGRSIHEMTSTRRQRDTMTDNLRACLDILAELWGFSNKLEAIRRGARSK